ncbi:MAG: PhoH family protein [Bacteroidales bacterium]|nr:PhoH family protein [Bacteroidales bacterium]
MIEKQILITLDKPVTFFGPRHKFLKIIQKHFINVEIHSRGNVITLRSNDEEALNEAINRLNQLISLINKQHSMSEELIDMFFENKEIPSVAKEIIIIHNDKGKAIKAYTPNQIRLVELAKSNDLILVTGPAGSGKTYTAIALAVKALKNHEVRRIVLSRPAVEAGENLGYLPGNLKDKLDPYLQPLYDALLDMMPKKKLEEYMEEGTIEIAPLAYMRGRTLDHAFVILDEAQNATTLQLKMFLTRMGKNAKFIITGDITQIDLTNKNMSGLIVALDILKNIENIGIIEFNETDIVRHKLVKDIVRAYEKWQNEKK